MCECFLVLILCSCLQLSSIGFCPRTTTPRIRQSFTQPTSTSCWESSTRCVGTSESCVTWSDAHSPVHRDCFFCLIFVIDFSLSSTRLPSTFQSSVSHCQKEKVKNKHVFFVHLTADEKLKNVAFRPFLRFLWRETMPSCWDALQLIRTGQVFLLCYFLKGLYWLYWTESDGEWQRFGQRKVTKTKWVWRPNQHNVVKLF